METHIADIVATNTCKQLLEVVSYYKIFGETKLKKRFCDLNWKMKQKTAPSYL